MLNAHSSRPKCRTEQSIFLAQVIVDTYFKSISNLSTGESGIKKHANLMYVLCVRKSIHESARSLSEEQWARFIHISISSVLPHRLIILA